MFSKKYMSETNTQVEEIQPTKEEVDKLKEEVEKGKTDLINVVDELKNERKSRQDLETKNKELEDTAKGDNPDEVETKVRNILGEERKVTGEKNEEVAKSRFYNENKEFHPDNDPGGIKRKVLEKELSGFDASKAYSVEEHLNLLNKAKRLIGEEKTPDTTVVTPEASIVDSGKTPTITESTKLTQDEKKLCEQIGMSEERFLKIKETQPKFLKSLLNR